MDELRYVRREDQSLIVSNDANEEFRIVVDDAMLSEIRSLARREREAGKVRPREIQALIRAGKTRAQVMELTGLDDVDIERFEEPVLAERRYVLERAHAVPVRTDAHTDEDQRFGTVIAERLIGLGAEASDWSSWRDEEAGWMIGLEFISYDVAHRAVWAFEHRKGALSPVTPDAITLSRQGEVGDRLIPKLRAVDNGDGATQFDAEAFADGGNTDGNGRTDEELTRSDVSPSSPSSEAPAPTNNSGMLSVAAQERNATPAGQESPATETPAKPTSVEHRPAQVDDLDPEADYERRREIDQRAIKTNDTSPVDLSQTADLLDALRRRRGERDQAHRAAALKDAEAATHDSRSDASAPSSPAGISPKPPLPTLAPADEPAPQPRSIWGASGVTGTPATPKASVASVAPLTSEGRGSEDTTVASDGESQESGIVDSTRPGSPAPAKPKKATNGRPPLLFPQPANTQKASPEQGTATPSDPEKGSRKGRASIPSWDDILFGTRSDEDPT